METLVWIQKSVASRLSRRREKIDGRRSMKMVHSEDTQLMRAKSDSVEGPLCEGWRSIDFSTLLQRYSSPEAWKDDKTTCILVHRSSYFWCCSTCQLCTYLLEMTNGSLSYRVVEFYVHRPEPISYHHVVLEAVISPYLYQSGLRHALFELSRSSRLKSSPMTYFKDASGSIDWIPVRRWIEECEHKHHLCALEQPQLADLVLIDCETRRLRMRENVAVPYVALSYVWGTGAQEMLVEDDLVGKCPQVIEDSMIVVKSLGMRYLWVDRYCVPQKDTQERHRLIRNMGKIYANSFVTLIAAAGNGADCGLPGVSMLPRWENHSLKLGLSEQTMVLTKFRTADDSKKDFVNSKWKTRGWTYQEGLHARRRLIFTRGPLCLECSSGGFACEKNLHLGRSQEFPSFYPNRSDIDTRDYIEQCIRDFSARQFTYECDALDAFRGTLELLRGGWNPYSHLCGVIYGPRGGNEEIAAQLAHGLLWQTRLTSTGQLEYPTRRQEFPSWSWLGWKFKPSRNEYFHEYFPDAQIPSHVSIAVELFNGLILKCEDGLEEMESHEEAEYRPTYLHISAWSIEFLKEDLIFGEDIWNKFRRSKRPKISNSTSMDVSRENLSAASYRAILMKEMGCLLVRETSRERIFERIGVLHLESWDGDSFLDENLARVGAEKMTTTIV